MKKLVVILFLGFLSCEKEGEFTTATPQIINLTDAVLLKSGTLSPTSGISGSGTVKVYLQNDVRKLILENYTVETGPDLKVYLSTTDLPNTFVNLGNANGSSVYTIPAQVDLSVYKYVLIHCQQFNHLFAVASLN